MQRRKMSKRHSKKVFRGNAGTHPKNSTLRPMRGGIRL